MSADIPIRKSRPMHHRPPRSLAPERGWRGARVPISMESIETRPMQSASGELVGDRPAVDGGKPASRSFQVPWQAPWRAEPQGVSSNKGRHWRLSATGAGSQDRQACLSDLGKWTTIQMTVAYATQRSPGERVPVAGPSLDHPTAGGAGLATQKAQNSGSVHIVSPRSIKSVAFRRLIMCGPHSSK